MKKIWAMRKNEEGVSPVIATILMVAITVVLAAVLYVMVLGIGGGNTTITPTIGTSPSTTATQYVWTVVTTSAPIQKSDIFVQLKPNGTATFLISTVLLTTASGTHGFVYSAAGSGTTIGAGDVIALSKDYAQGTVINLVTPGGAGTIATLTVP